MTSVRKSKRYSTVKKSELLAKKLEERRKKRKRKAEEEISPQEGSSEQNVETEEFFDTNEDLEWDSSADFEESHEDVENPAIYRRNTSTDYNLLEEPVGEIDQIWPPRNPSEEPTDPNLSIFDLPRGYSIESIIETLEDEVFEDLGNLFSAMDQGEYNRRFREVKVARENVRSSIEHFPVALVENLDSQGIDSERRAITDCVKIFNDKVSNLKVDLDGDEHEEDARRLSNLDKIKKEISDEVLTHKKLIGEKFESIKNAKDAAKKDAEKAVRDQEKAAEKAEKERLNELTKTEKKNKIEVRHSSILLSVNKLKTSVSALKPIDSLSDVEVKQAFSRVTEWKKEISKIKESKTQFDVDVVGVGLEQTKIDDLKSNFEELVKSFLQIQIDVEKADKERSLYLSHKPVKELSVYPAPFGGKANENVYKFKQKMIEAMEANQIAEKDKIEVLRKHLKGFPKDSISDDVNVKNVTEAFEILIKAFGNPSATWEAI